MTSDCFHFMSSSTFGASTACLGRAFTGAWGGGGAGSACLKAQERLRAPPGAADASKSFGETEKKLRRDQKRD